MLLCIAIPAVVAGQFTSIPDSNFEQALIDLGIDSDGEVNGTVATADISPIQTLDVSSRDIQNLQGLEDFNASLKHKDQLWINADQAAKKLSWLHPVTSKKM